MNSRGNIERDAQASSEPALYDTLTDLPNRISFQDTLRHGLITAQRSNKPLALLCLDLDRFHEVNSTFGHAWGDVILQQVGPRIRSTLRKFDVLARLGGDEFAILLSAVGGEKSAMRVVQRIIGVLEQPFLIEQHPVGLAASIGVALCPEHGTDAETLLRRAEIAMHVAKRTHNGYAFYAADQDHYSPERIALMGELRRAIEHNQLVLYYQPKVNVATGQVERVEALIRWHHPQHGLLWPERFIPLAEKTGLIKPLSAWVLNDALRQCHAWRQEGLEVSVAVNLSMRNLQEPRLPEQVAELLAAWNIAAPYLEVELTESSLAADPQSTSAILARLSDMGVRISVDDFGTGYSSLALLKRLPVDEVKLDRSFVVDMAVNENDAAIVRSTIDLVHTLGMQVASEGVENQATLDLLATFGCDLAQGYYLSRPMPAAELTHWLQESPRRLSTQSVMTLTRPHIVRRSRRTNSGEKP